MWLAIHSLNKRIETLPLCMQIDGNKSYLSEKYVYLVRNVQLVTVLMGVHSFSLYSLEKSDDCMAEGS